ncbi:MAG TPA: preprotein translocase subunit YajC [Synergistaceae bacterium]|nr:preprotein translocase subunit YajC [Synergistaceae bacterium]NLL40508.1 preprotein translocase subunit YajC [Synergistaceae bacterium]HPX03199.1 preprotein translocase subunit YajC [Synergistaceae bacterium]HQA53941.1 preprotein translocase subunit YajC [Synergistaceae bacterium]
MGGQQGGLVGMMLPLAMFAAIFYFMIIRPQKKKQKAHEEMLASISRGSTIITAGGFFGIVREILDDSYIIELDEGVKARILKSSVSMKKADGSSEARPKKKKVKKDEIPAETAEVQAPAAEAEEAAVSEKEEA